MIFPIQPPIPPANTAATTSVNTVVTIQAINSASAVGEGSGGASPLSTLANGTTVQGFVVNRDAQNNPILRTAIGDLRVTSEVFLKTGSEVTIRVDNTLSSLARIVAVDGLSPQDYNNLTQAARSALTKDTITPSTLQTLAPSTNTTKAGAPPAAPVLQAIILQGQPAATTPSLLTAALAATQSGPVQALAQLAQLRAGTPIRLTVLDLKLPPIPVALGALPASNKLEGLLPPTTPTPTAQSQTSTPIANPALLGADVQSAETVQKTTLLTSAPPAQDEIEALQSNFSQKVITTATLQATKAAEPLLNPPAQIVTVSNNSAAPKTAERPELIAAGPNQISVSVIGHDADGANIIHTPFATLKAYTPQPLPSGTTLLVTAQVETDTTILPSTTIAEEQLASIAPTSDKAIDDVLAWMIANQPDAALQLRQQLPDIQRNLASSLLFFIAAIKGGDLGAMIGKRGLRVLETTAPELLARMRAEVGQIQATISDSPMSNWTLYPLSMMAGNELQHARLYVGKDPNENNEAQPTNGRGQRFVLEVELSQLGPMQFDGFVRSKDGKKSFDLMVRSANPLEPALSHEIRTIFENSAAITGLKGQLIFQEGNQHFIRPMADTKPRANGDGVNTILA
jgi:hypothetical protein